MSIFITDVVARMGNGNRWRNLYSCWVRITMHSLELSNEFRCSDKVFIAPSGVQKERIEPTHIFVLPYPQMAPSPHTDRVFLRRPAMNLKESACTPLFWNSFDFRDAGSCIHTHSQHAVMATLLWTGPVFTISHQVRQYVCSRILQILTPSCLLGGKSSVFTFGMSSDHFFHR